MYRTRPFAPIYACFVVCCMPSVAHGIQCADSQESSKLLSVGLLGLVHQTDDSKWRPDACNGMFVV